MIVLRRGRGSDTRLAMNIFANNVVAVATRAFSVKLCLLFAIYSVTSAVLIQHKPLMLVTRKVLAFSRSTRHSKREKGLQPAFCQTTFSTAAVGFLNTLGVELAKHDAPTPIKPFEVIAAGVRSPP